MADRVVIVGAGQAGLQTAVSLRQAGFAGEILMVGREPHLPYQRPPLSKQALKGEWPFEKCLLRHAGYFAEHDIALRLSTVAEHLDTARATLTLDDGATWEYDHLVICTGSRLNRLPLAQSGIEGVHYLRTLDHALAILPSLREGARVVIAGGGYIGLEVAATAREKGCAVTVVEPQDHVMKRAALTPIADFLLEKHRREGIKVLLGSQVTEILGHRSVHAVVLDDAETLEADLLLMGIGVRPDLRWLEGGEIITGRGVRVNVHCQTNIESVYAAGDVCELQHPLYPGWWVLESVQNAVSQGRVVASNITGRTEQYTDVPWFWSDQYDCRVQMAGLPQADDYLVIRQSGPKSISVLSIGRDRLHAVQCVNAPRDYMSGRKLIALGNSVAYDRLGDPQVDLKELL